MVGKEGRERARTNFTAAVGSTLEARTAKRMKGRRDVQVMTWSCVLRKRMSDGSDMDALRGEDWELRKQR